MKRLIRFSQFFLILILISSCKTLIEREPKILDSDIQDKKSNIEEKNKMEIRVSCGEGDVSKFLKEGWIIVEESTEEKVCTWKSFTESNKLLCYQ